MESELQPLLAFSSRTSAEAVASLLESEGVPCVIEATRLAGAIEAEVALSVPRSLAHRARWLLTQGEWSEGELTYIATGELGDRRDR